MARPITPQQMAYVFENLSRAAMEIATRRTLTGLAFEGRKAYKENIKKEFVLRNKRTIQGVRMTEAKRGSINQQFSVVGHLDDWMRRQEFGGTHIGRKTIPTQRAAGQSRGLRPRTKAVRRPNYLKRIDIDQGYDRIQARMREAAKSGKRFIYADLGRREGIFKVIGNTKRMRLDMIYSTGHRGIVTKPRYVLRSAKAEAMTHRNRLFRSAIDFQLQRINLSL